ncbi:MAG: hypothetical protein QXV73_05175 [Candidatus Micrarchaeia archaeon]
MKIAKRTENKIILPYRKHEKDAGIDLCANGDYIIEPFDVKVISTGVSVDIPENCMGWITNKSRSNFLVGAGVVDEGYTGELLVKIFNPTKYEVKINHGDAIAQLIILPILRPDLEWVLSIDFFDSKSERGESGGIKSNL